MGDPPEARFREDRFRPDRRRFLRMAGAAGLAGLGAGAGLALRDRLPRWLGARSSHGDLDHAATLARLVASLTDGQRRALVLPLDHPSRQLTNTIALFRGPHIGTLMDAEQVGLVERLYETMTSASGRRDLANTVGLEGRLEGSVVAIYGDPADGRAHTMISGAHILLRGGGASSTGVAFGGPIAYGQQVGNGRYRVEGNAFAFHSDRANDFYAALAPDEQRRARAERPIHELVMQAQGADGRFTGVAVGETREPARAAARALVDAVLSTWNEADRRDAWSCIDHNGGLEALHVTFYESKGFYPDGAVWSELTPDERARREAPYWQVWRIEGPGTAIHFKGSPHVHAYVNIARDPARQNVGETLAETRELLEGPALARLIEAALRLETGEPLAYQPVDEVPGRFCPGPVTTGLAWTLDPYGNRVAVATVATEAMAPPLRESLEASGATLAPGQRIRVAVAEYFAGREDLLGRPERVETGSRKLREAIVDTLRRNGLDPAVA